MRPALLLLPLLALGVAAAEPYAILLDWQEGASLLGIPTDASRVDGATDAIATSFPLVVPECNRDVLADLLYEPRNDTLAVEGVGSVTLPRVFRVELRENGTLVASVRVADPGYGWRVGTVEPGEYDVRVQAWQGGPTAWSLRVRGHEVYDDPACQNGIPGAANG